ncbi:MAG: amidohydrolase family protein [Candidatus Hodarchaeales archaeon]
MNDWERLAASNQVKENGAKMDIAIINSWLITFPDSHLGIIPNGGLGIEDGKISFVGSMNDFSYQAADRIIDAMNHVTLPGLINAHVHTKYALLRGAAQDLPEIEWMNKGIGPFALHMTQADALAGAKLGVLEGLRSGTTTFAEYANNVAQVVEEVYLPFQTRVVATEVINEVSRNRSQLKPTDLYEFDRSQGEEALRGTEELFKRFRKQHLVSCHYGPQALDMISLELLKVIREEVIARDTRMHMHVAQGGRERLQIQGRYGKDASTVKVLSKHGLLDEYLLAAHCHDTDENERELMVQRAAKLVGCPSSIGMIDGIVPPIGHYLELGGVAALGSDQAPGPGHHNMFREMCTASLLTKTLLRDPTILPAWKALQLGTMGGARFLGLDDKIGSLEVGKQADVITIDLNRAHLAPLVAKPFHNFIPNLVYSSTGTEVDNVIIQGQPIMLDGIFVQIDEQAIVAEANRRAERVFEEATEDWVKAGSKLVRDVKEGRF